MSSHQLVDRRSFVKVAGGARAHATARFESGGHFVPDRQYRARKSIEEQRAIRIRDLVKL